ncbi:MAG: DEAD/DEAH box helicase [Bacteroidota bacterium]|jgi:ATP-dependent RNA helicase DeaD
MNFKDLGLSQDLLKAVADLGFENPTPIQEKTIPALLTGNKDVVALAQTGTGKTAAFGLPLLGKINENTKRTQALILAPTRELCVQICNDLKNFSKYILGLRILPVYGGAAITNQINDLKKGVQIVVATPGRLVDLIDRKAIQLGEVDYVILDEADEMLNMGFKEDLDMILAQTPSTKNVWLFSATMAPEVSRISRKYMSEPIEISVGKKNQGADNIEHVFYMVHSRDRYLALKRVADFYPEIYGLIFCRTKIETQEVADALIKDGYSADALHGDLSQAQRDFVMKRFRNKTLQMLVATDVAARGIDVDNISHVINYNLPDDDESYTHRSGRTARAGRSGISIAIVSKRDVGRIKDLERKIGKSFKKSQVPSGVEVCEKQLFHLVHKLHHVEVMDEEIEKYLPKVYEELNELSKEELIKRFVSEEFNRFYNYYQNAPDLNDGNESSGNKGNGRTVRFFLNLGNYDGLNKLMLKDYLTDLTRIHPRMIFNIDIKDSFSFFETETKFKDNFLALNQAEIEFNGRRLNLEESAGRGNSGGGFKSEGRARFNNRNNKSGGGYSNSKFEKGGHRGSSGSRDSRDGGGFRDKFRKKRK